MEVSIMGYNKTSNLIWFYSRGFFEFYEYDENTHEFTLRDKKNAPTNGVGKPKENNEKGFESSRWWAFMKGDVVWYNGYGGAPGWYISCICLDKRSLDDPSTSLQYIDVQYLGTRSVPQSIIYDPPYIWVLVERDDQIQMLKLLPNE
jgi:cysteinyl-tRNA synthetase